MTPTLSMHTIGSLECKGQANTIVQIPYWSGTRESNKQLPKYVSIPPRTIPTCKHTS